MRVDILAVAAFHIIGDDVEIVWFVAQQLLEQSTNDWNHSRREDHNWHVVCLGPLEELDEMGIQLHFLAELVNTFVEGSFNAVQHVVESVTK